MKKYILFLILFFLVGCGNNKNNELVCNYAEGNKEYKVSIYFKNHESVNYNKVVNIIFDNSHDASNYTIDENYDDMKVVDNKVSLYVSENIDNMTIKEVKSMYEKYGYICNDL